MSSCVTATAIRDLVTESSVCRSRPRSAAFAFDFFVIGFGVWDSLGMCLCVCDPVVHVPLRLRSSCQRWPQSHDILEGGKPVHPLVETWQEFHLPFIK